MLRVYPSAVYLLSVRPSACLPEVLMLLWTLWAQGRGTGGGGGWEVLLGDRLSDALRVTLQDRL